MPAWATITPFGNAKTRQKVFCNLQQALCWNLFTALGNSFLVLLFNCGAHSRHTAVQYLFSNCTLRFGKFCKNCIDIDSLRLNSLRLWTLRKFWWCFEERTARALATAFATFATLVAITTFATWAALATFTAWTTTLVAIASALFAQLLSDWFERLLRGE